jgi:hypothetical protein
MPKCTVCNHPQLLEINQAILSKDFTLAILSQKFGLHPSSLQRHKNHIEINMSRAHRRLREIRDQGSLLLLNDILEKVRRHIAAADAEGNYLAVFRGSHVASRIIHQLGRIEGNMQPDTLHRLIASPAWTPEASLLPTDPGLMSGLHQGLLDGAFAPCPEPPSEISAAATGAAAALDLVHPFPETWNSELETQFDLCHETRNSELETGLATLCRLLPDLDLTLDDISPEAEPEAKNYRKITEKSAPNIPPNTEKNLQYQDHEPSEKNFPKNPACEAKTTAPAAISATGSPPAVPDGTDPGDPQVVDLSQEVSVGRENTRRAAAAQVHPAVSATDESQEILDEALAAELAAYLADFPPYGKGARDPNPDPCAPDPSSQIPDPCPARPPLNSPSHTPPGSGPSRPPNFGNPGLFQSMKGNFM